MECIPSLDMNNRYRSVLNWPEKDPPANLLTTNCIVGHSLSGNVLRKDLNSRSKLDLDFRVRRPSLYLQKLSHGLVSELQIETCDGTILS